ncbi:unnamed protein product [Calicophoron daubneyi]|uniref:RRM domain-containing protein n=1 Tax=Calicophoron daubneyi TaxID=300641 RepID=A0AAV2TG71_CALDB
MVKTVSKGSDGSSTPSESKSSGSKVSSKEDSKKRSRGVIRDPSSGRESNKSSKETPPADESKSDGRSSARRRRWGSTNTDRQASKLSISSDSLEKLVPTLTTTGVKKRDQKTTEISAKDTKKETSPLTRQTSAPSKIMETNEGNTEREIELEVEVNVENIDGEEGATKVEKSRKNENSSSNKADSKNSLVPTHKSSTHTSSKREHSSRSTEKANKQEAVSSSTSNVDPSKSSTKKHSPSKRKGPKETKAVGYLVEQPERVEPSQPAKHRPTDIVYIRSLVRPFTAEQLKEMISTRYGKVVDLWLDRIKSSSLVRLQSVEIATSCREGLDGSRWPSMNPRVLRCDFGNDELFAWMKENGDSSDSQPPKYLVLGEKPPSTDHSSEASETKRPITNSEAPGIRENKPNDLRRKLDEKEESSRTSRRSPSATKDSTAPEIKRKCEEPAKLLDDLFRKTTATPCIYWLPLPDEQARLQATERAKIYASRQSTKPSRPSDQSGSTQRATRSPFAGPAASVPSPSKDKPSNGSFAKPVLEADRAPSKHVDSSKPTAVKSKGSDGIDKTDRRKPVETNVKTKSRLPEFEGRGEKTSSGTGAVKKGPETKSDRLSAEKRKREQSPFSPARNDSSSGPRGSDKPTSVMDKSATNRPKSDPKTNDISDAQKKNHRDRSGRSTSSRSRSSTERGERRRDLNEEDKRRRASPPLHRRSRSRSRSFHRREISPATRRSHYRPRR